MAAFQDAEDALADRIRADRARLARILSRGIHVYDSPTMKPRVFEDIFPGPFDEDATSDALRVASAHRQEVVDATSYHGAKPDARSVAGAMAQYFPDIWSLTESLRKAGSVGKVKLNMRGVLRFVWNSVLDRESRSSSTWSHQTFVFEIVMLLAHMGLAHSNIAANCAAAGDLPGASKMLRKGAGILKFAGAEVIPKWKARPKNKLPLEAEIHVLDACAQIMLAQSQQIAIAKALTAKKGLALGTLAKLCMGCHQIMNEAATTLRRLPKADFDRLDHGLLECAGFWLKFYSSVANHFTAQGSHAAEKWGEAAAVSRRAAKECETIATLQHGELASLDADVCEWKASVREWQKTYVDENEQVYFDLPEPGADRLPKATPQLLGSTKSEPFEIPRGGERIFNFVNSELVDQDNKKRADDGKSSDDAELETAVSMCAAMGFDESRAREVLPDVGNDVQRAVDILSAEPEASEGKKSDVAGGGKSNKQRYQVTIPAGLKAGESVALPLPSGKQHILKIPEGYDPSKSLDVVVEV